MKLLYIFFILTTASTIETMAGRNNLQHTSAQQVSPTSQKWTKATSQEFVKKQNDILQQSGAQYSYTLDDNGIILIQHEGQAAPQVLLGNELDKIIFDKAYQEFVKTAGEVQIVEKESNDRETVHDTFTNQYDNKQLEVTKTQQKVSMFSRFNPRNWLSWRR